MFSNSFVRSKWNYRETCCYHLSTRCSSLIKSVYLIELFKHHLAYQFTQINLNQYLDKQSTARKMCLNEPLNECWIMLRRLQINSREKNYLKYFSKLTFSIAILFLLQSVKGEENWKEKLSEAMRKLSFLRQRKVDGKRSHLKWSK